MPVDLDPRPLWRAMRLGFAKSCPACGRARLYGKYLKVAAVCPHCGTELHHQRADDAPPYFTIVAVGHIVVPSMLVLEQWASPPGWLQAALWLPMTLVLSLVLLPKIKGALIGMQWANRMHGFGGATD